MLLCRARHPGDDSVAEEWSQHGTGNCCACQDNTSLQKRRSTSIEMLLYGIRQRPILPGRVQPSTFGTEGLNCCVRNGNRWNPFVIATGNGELFTSPVASASRLSHCSTFSLPCQALAFAPAPSSAGTFLHPDNCTSNDSTSDRFPISLIFVLRSPEATKRCNQALDLLVSSSSIRYRTSTDDLSTW